LGITGERAWSEKESQCLNLSLNKSEIESFFSTIRYGHGGRMAGLKRLFKISPGDASIIEPERKYPG